MSQENNLSAAPLSEEAEPDKSSQQKISDLVHRVTVLAGPRQDGRAATFESQISQALDKLEADLTETRRALFLEKQRRTEAREWVKIDKEDDSTYPHDHGPVDFATKYDIHHGGYYGSSRYGCGNFYLQKSDDKPPYWGVDDVTHWRQIRTEENPNKL